MYMELIIIFEPVLWTLSDKFINIHKILSAKSFNNAVLKYE